MVSIELKAKPDINYSFNDITDLSIVSYDNRTCNVIVCNDRGQRESIYKYEEDKTAVLIDFNGVLNNYIDVDGINSSTIIGNIKELESLGVHLIGSADYATVNNGLSGYVEDKVDNLVITHKQAIDRFKTYVSRNYKTPVIIKLTNKNAMSGIMNTIKLSGVHNVFTIIRNTNESLCVKARSNLLEVKGRVYRLEVANVLKSQYTAKLKPVNGSWGCSLSGYIGKRVHK